MMLFCVNAVVLVDIIGVASAFNCDCSSELLLVLLMLVVADVLDGDSCLVLVLLLDCCC